MLPRLTVLLAYWGFNMSDKPVHDVLEEMSKDPKLAKKIAQNPDQELAARGIPRDQIEILKSLDADRIGELLAKEESGGVAAAAWKPTITVKIIIKF
jgi:hypothetical protein